MQQETVFHSFYVSSYFSELFPFTICTFFIHILGGGYKPPFILSKLTHLHKHVYGDGEHRTVITIKIQNDDNPAQWL